MYKILIDWLAFTVDKNFDAEKNGWSMERNAKDTMLDFLGSTWSSFEGHMAVNSGEFEITAGRAPYRYGLRYEGCTLYFSDNDNVNHVLFEVSGRGCDTLRGMGLLDEFIIKSRERATRIDLAVDLENDVMPTEFESEATNGRFKSHGVQKSSTGETVYIGGRQSERYCRVYRYFKPHPRAKFLRCEFVFRKGNAKLFAAQYVESGGDLNALALGAGQVYGFEHEAWNLTGDEILLSSYTPERRQGKTVTWLITQVAPAFKRLVDEDVIDDPVQFIYDHFLSEGNNNV